MSLILLSSKTFQVISIRQRKNTLVSRNASDEKNLRPGGRKFIFLKSVFRKYSLFFFSFFCCCFLGVFLYSCFFFCCCFCLFVYFLKLKVYILIHVAYERRNIFTRPTSGSKTAFFLALVEQ